MQLSGRKPFGLQPLKRRWGLLIVVVAFVQLAMAQVEPKWVLALDKQQYVKDVFPINRGGYAFTSMYYSDTLNKLNAPREIVVGKFNHKGKLLWEVRLNAPSKEVPSEIIELSDGRLFVFGSSRSGVWGTAQSNGSGDAFMLELSRIGELKATYLLGTRQYDQLSEAAYTGDGFLIGGFTEYGSFDKVSDFDSKDAFIAKVDMKGNLLWWKNFGISKRDNVSKINVNEDGSFDVLCVVRGIYPNHQDDTNRYWLVGFDKNGERLNEVLFDATGMQLYKLDDGYLTVGKRQTPDTLVQSLGKQSLTAVLYDRQGQRIWGKYFGGELEEFYCASYFLNDRLYIIYKHESLERRYEHVVPTFHQIVIDKNGEMISDKILLEGKISCSVFPLDLGFLIALDSNKLMYFRQ
ncbi:MAG: hypothetical protein IT258_02290 [Saprospiraceae bacterium]|nr:hypothetical protein [Saprospiraceae bacterium]